MWNVVERVMKKKGFTQYQLAKRAGIYTSTLSDWKKGRIKKPSFELMCKIADALEVSLDEFRG